MTEKTTGVLPPARHRQLLVTATREFASAGFEQASLNAIIRACGMSKSSFYHYYASKQALFDSVVTEASKALVDDLDPPDPDDLTDPDFWSHIEALFLRLLVLSAQQPWYIDLGKLFYLTDASAAHGTTMRHSLDGATAWLDAALDAGRCSGAIRTDLPTSLQGALAFAVLQAMDRWSLQHAQELDATEQQHLVTQQLDLLRRMLAP